MLHQFLNRRVQNAPKEMAFVDHLEALRWHVIRSVLAVALLAIFLFIKIDWIFDVIISGPLQNHFITYTGLCKLSQQLGFGNSLCMPPLHVTLQTTAFDSQFVSSIIIACVGGFIVASPYIFLEIWWFIKPALSPKELYYSRGIIVNVSVLFLVGAAFGYFILAPFTFNFLANYTIGSTYLIQAKPTLNDYLENLVNIILGCGLSFEMPVVAYFLTRIGLITPKLLQVSRKYAIVIILVVAAVITPSPDWTSQMIVFIPLIILYELSIMVSKRAYRTVEKKKTEFWS